jgi:8-oxo-dGTP pyrophosphatase MutT (NUDIX family)
VSLNASESVRLHGPPLRPAPTVLPSGARLQRVRCVIGNGRQFLLVQANSRRSENIGKWSLPGGRLKARETPRAGLRRELAEELGFRAPGGLVELGDWRYDHEYHRVFGYRVERIEPTLQADEILASAWLDYSDVKRLAVERELRWGFELAAITMFRRVIREPASSSGA